MLEKKRKSRIVKQKITLPVGVVYSHQDDQLVVKGEVGEESLFFPSAIVIKNDSSEISFESDLDMPLLGTFVVLFKNAVNGVSKKYEKIINLFGVGYKVLFQNGVLEFFLGYSHSIKMVVPLGIDCVVTTPTQLSLMSCSKARLGDFAAKLFKLRRVNPYKTKGIIEKDAFVLKKEGKKS